MATAIQTKSGNFRYKYSLRFAFRAALFLGLIVAFAVYNSFNSAHDEEPLGSSLDHRRLQEDDSNRNGIFQKQADPKWMLAPYICGILYTFLALAIVCDEYFVPALEEMSGENQLNLSLDIAGATLMAAGGSAPELFTSIIGTFNESSVGFGAIVGSAVFNVLFVIGMCSLCSKETLQLTWWPLARDTTYYSISLLVLAIFVGVVSEGEVELWEAIILFVMYFGYVGVMAVNEKLRVMITGTSGAKDEESNQTKPTFISFRYPMTFRAGLVTLIRDPDSWQDKARVGLVAKVAGNIDDVFAFVDTDDDGEIVRDELARCFSKLEDNDVSERELDRIMSDLDENKNGTVTKTEFKTWYINSESHLRGQIKNIFNRYDENESDSISKNEFKTMITEVIPKLTEEEIEETADHLFSDDIELSFDDFVQWYFNSTHYQNQKQKQEAKSEEESETLCETLSPPKDAGLLGFLKWIILFPLVLTLALTIPDVRKKNVPGKLCYVAFILSIAWIGVYSYFMVGWAECVGNTVGIPPYIMGLTFLAAGTSVPDLLSSVIVARMGEGDMAVSSSIGSNIFDILVGLPFPWLLYIIFPNDKSSVMIEANGVWLSIIILLIMLVLVIGSIHLSKWQLTKKLGISMFIFYIAFLVQAVLREYL